MTISRHSIQKVSTVDDNKHENETCWTTDKCTDHIDSLLKEIDNNNVDDKKRKNDESESECEIKNKEEEEEDEMEDEIYYQKARQLLCYDDAPEYLKHNCFILSGYRGILNTKLCLESVFWWTNETINIWSHIFGFILFTTLAIRDILMLQVEAGVYDKLVLSCVLLCFQVCMIMSSLYHTFSCRSEQDCDIFLCYDLFGIALSLFAIYVSGIYYAFWCDKGFLLFYLITVTLIFIVAMLLQIPRFNIHPNVKMLTFVAWAAYGVIPTVHWAVLKGGFANPLVALLIPRVVGMYVISGVAFLVYLTKIPERFYSGKFDYLGHSHQWWHLLVVWALLYWHNSGMIYLDYRHNHACPSSAVIL